MGNVKHIFAAFLFVLGTGQEAIYATNLGAEDLGSLNFLLGMEEEVTTKRGHVPYTKSRA